VSLSPFWAFSCRHKPLYLNNFLLGMHFGSKIVSFLPLFMTGWSPLIRYVVREAFSETELGRLMEDLNQTSTYGSYPLHFAALRRDPRFVAFFLQQEGEDVNKVNFFRESALHWAVKSGREEVVSALLQANARPDLRDSDNASPIDWAVQEDQTHLLPLLRGSNRQPLLRRCLSLIPRPPSLPPPS
jgi:ankyrin repeat protein